MIGRCLLLALSLFFSEVCFAQQSYQLTKQQKKELKKLQKEGWKTLNPAAALAEQYSDWCQKEAEQRADGSNKYTMMSSEFENTNLEMAKRRAWGDACAAIRKGESLKVTNSIKTKESFSSYGDGKVEEHSDIAMSQRDEMAYADTMNDIVEVLAIYKKVENAYIVRIVAAKENK